MGWRADAGIPARMETSDHDPGDPAPHTGEYHEINVFGSHTGRRVYADAGTRLPSLPRGYTWRYAPDRGKLERDSV